MQSTPNTIISIINSCLDIVEDDTDHYIYCASDHYNADVMAEFSMTDCCVRIDDIELFIDAVTRELGDRADGEHSIMPVIYVDSYMHRNIIHSSLPGLHVVQYSQDFLQMIVTPDFRSTYCKNPAWHHSLPPVWIKSNQYSYQGEVRILWTSRGQPINMEKITSRDVARACSMYHA